MSYGIEQGKFSMDASRPTSSGRAWSTRSRQGMSGFHEELWNDAVGD
ncbi:MAG: hypothetical protein ABI818_09755 [Acidobacteriota bacterium]